MQGPLFSREGTGIAAVVFKRGRGQRQRIAREDWSADGDNGGEGRGRRRQRRRKREHGHEQVGRGGASIPAGEWGWDAKSAPPTLPLRGTYRGAIVSASLTGGSGDEAERGRRRQHLEQHRPVFLSQVQVCPFFYFWDWGPRAGKGMAARDRTTTGTRPTTLGAAAWDRTTGGDVPPVEGDGRA